MRIHLFSDVPIRKFANRKFSSDEFNVIFILYFLKILTLNVFLGIAVFKAFFKINTFFNIWVFDYALQHQFT